MCWWAGLWGLWKWDLQHWRSPRGDIFKTIVYSNCFFCLFSQKEQSLWNFENHGSERVHEYKIWQGCFSSRWPLPAWSWRRTGRGNIFWWQLSAMLRKIWTKSWQWRNVAPMGNNWPPTTGVAGATMGKALSLPGEWLCYLSKGWLKTERFRQKYIKSGQKVVVKLLFSQAFILLKALNNSWSLFIFSVQLAVRHTRWSSVMSRQQLLD